MGSGGGEGAGGCGHALAAFKYSLNTYRKCEPGLCSGEETQARGGVDGGGGEGAEGCGHALAAFKYSVNTQCNQVWVVARPGWCGVGGEGVGGCGHALAAFKYSLNTKKMRARSV